MIKKNKTKLTTYCAVFSLLKVGGGGGGVSISQPSAWEQMARNVMITKSRRLK